MVRTSETPTLSTSSQQMRQWSPPGSLGEESLSRARETSWSKIVNLASLLLLVDQCCVCVFDDDVVFYQVPYSEKEKGYGFTFKDDPSLPVSIKSSSPHAQVSSMYTV